MTERTLLPIAPPGTRAYAVGRVELRCADCGQVLLVRWTPGDDVRLHHVCRVGTLGKSENG